MYYVLLYDYIKEGLLEKRAPHREKHLGLLNKLKDEGKMVMAGAWNDPIDGAVFVFTDKPAAEGLVKVDPYVANGLVTRWRIREWNVVVGG